MLTFHFTLDRISLGDVVASLRQIIQISTSQHSLLAGCRQKI
jgi:hypothetical protein